MDRLAHIVSEGVAVDVRASPTDLVKAIAYGNHKSVHEHADVVWKKLKDDVRRDRTLLFHLSDARKV